MGLFDAFKKKNDYDPVPDSGAARNLREARKGDTCAMIELAQCYEVGQNGVPVHPEQMVYWYTKAAQKGSTEAMRQLAAAYAYGYGDVEIDEDLAEEWYERAAKAGDVNAMQIMGMHYRYDGGDDDDDEGDLIDAEQALYWFRKAADKGDAVSTRELGLMYEKGVGVQADPQKARELYRAAAPKDCEAAYRLGMIYKEGRDVAADYEYAFGMFSLAAKYDQKAALELAQCYAQGRGTLPNAALGYRWAKKAAGKGGTPAAKSLMKAMNQQMNAVRVSNMRELVNSAMAGNARACYRLGFIYEAGVDTQWNGDESFKWYRKAMQLGYEAAIYPLAQLHERGEGVKKDMYTAVQMYGEAANRGEWDATYRLGELGLERGDPAGALKMFRIAAQQGHVRAQFKVGQMLIMGKGTEANVAEGLEWMRKAAENGCPDAVMALEQIGEK